MNSNYLFSMLVCLSVQIHYLVADPAPHSNRSKLYILSRLAFNYLDMSGDSRLSEGEIDAMRTFTVNGLQMKSMFDVKRLREAMDKNRNGFVDEDEFITFEHWLPLFINGRPNSAVPIRELLKYAKASRDPPAYVQLDENRDGMLDYKELTSNN